MWSGPITNKDNDNYNNGNYRYYHLNIDIRYNYNNDNDSDSNIDNDDNNDDYNDNKAKVYLRTAPARDKVPPASDLGEPAGNRGLGLNVEHIANKWQQTSKVKWRN